MRADLRLRPTNSAGGGNSRSSCITVSICPPLMPVALRRASVACPPESLHATSKQAHALRATADSRPAGKRVSNGAASVRRLSTTSVRSSRGSAVIEQLPQAGRRAPRPSRGDAWPRARRWRSRRSAGRRRRGRERTPPEIRSRASRRRRAYSSAFSSDESGISAQRRAVGRRGCGGRRSATRIAPTPPARASSSRPLSGSSRA